MKTTSDDNGPVIINPAGYANSIGETPMQHVDHRIMDDNGNLLIPPDTEFRDEKRAKRLGVAAKGMTYGSDLRDEIAPHAASHHAAEAWLESVEPRRTIAEERHQENAQTWRDLNRAPHRVSDPTRKKIALIAIALYIVGDTGVLANAQYRSGTPLLLGLIVGLALATTCVLVGKQTGHEMAAAAHRKLRGPAPDDCPPVAVTFYDRDDEANNLWLMLTLAAAVCMFLSIFLLGIGSGDPTALALGYGLLGSLTVAGSLCAEAYASNDLAEHLNHADDELTKSSSALEEFEGAERDSAQAQSMALLTETSARHTAQATEITVAERASRPTDHPDIAGYIDPGHTEVPEGPPKPVEVEVVPARDRDTKPARNRKRPRYSMHADEEPSAAFSGELQTADPLIAGASPSTNGHANKVGRS